jgi:hypothetical protein
MTAKERVWLAEFLRCFDATAAARAAGYKSARKQGWQKKQKFKEVIEAELTTKAMAADEALARLADRARLDIGPYVMMGEAGRVFIDLERLIADGLGHHIKGIIHTPHGDRVVFHDQQEALLTIARLLGLDKAAVAMEPLEIIVRRGSDEANRDRNT